MTNLQSVISDLSEAVRAAPDQPYPLYSLASSYHRLASINQSMQLIESARTKFQEALKKFPKFADGLILYALVHLYVHAGDMSSAQYCVFACTYVYHCTDALNVCAIVHVRYKHIHVHGVYTCIYTVYTVCLQSDAADPHGMVLHCILCTLLRVLAVHGALCMYTLTPSDWNLVDSASNCVDFIMSKRSTNTTLLQLYKGRDYIFRPIPPLQMWWCP